MSRLRQRAARVREAGDVKRQNWSPAAGSADYKRYQWYYRQIGEYEPMNENFCHYWRIVVVWATLLKLKKPGKYVGLTLVGLAIAVFAVTLVLTIVKQPLVLVAVAGLFAASCYLVWCLAVALEDHYELTRGEFGLRTAWMYDSNRAVKSLYNLTAIPFVVPYLIFVPGALYLHRRKAPMRIMRWFAAAHFGDEGVLTWIRPWLIVPAGVAVFSFVPTTHGVTLGFRWALFGLVIVAILTGLVVYLAMKASQRRGQPANPSAVSFDKETARVPGRISRFFHGVGDMLALVWSIIVVNKWKICPKVTLPH